MGINAATEGKVSRGEWVDTTKRGLYRVRRPPTLFCDFIACFEMNPTDPALHTPENTVWRLDVILNNLLAAFVVVQVFFLFFQRFLLFFLEGNNQPLCHFCKNVRTRQPMFFGVGAVVWISIDGSSCCVHGSEQGACEAELAVAHACSEVCVPLCASPLFLSSAHAMSAWC